MTSFGRGRGILPSKQTVSGPTRSIVKCYPIIKQSSAEHLVTLPPDNAISVSESDNSESAINLHSFEEKLISLSEKDSLFQLITDVINDSNCTVDIVNEMIQIIIDRCMWLPTVSRKFAGLLNFLCSHKIFGRDIKRFTLTALQTIYEDRDTLKNSKKYGECTFRNAVILIAEVYYRYRMEEGNRFKLFVGPILTYLKMLVNSSDENDILIIAQQFSWSCDHMKSVDLNGVNELMLDIHHSIISNRNHRTEKGNCLLLLCVELFIHPLENFSEDIKEFYSKVLKESMFSTIAPPSLDLNDDQLKHYTTIRKFFS